jgi:hypothetical protein
MTTISHEHRVVALLGSVPKQQPHPRIIEDHSNDEDAAEPARVGSVRSRR